MKIYLVRKKQLDGTIIEYECPFIETAREAAIAVFEDNMAPSTSIRYRFNSATGVEIPYEPTKYDEVVEITAHQVSSLPKARPRDFPLFYDFDKAALSAALLYASETGMPADPVKAAGALMRAIIDYSFDGSVNTKAVDLPGTLEAIGQDRGDDGKDDSIRLLSGYVRSLDVTLDGDPVALAKATFHFVTESGVEGAEDPAVLNYHLIRGLIAVVESNGVDFTHMMAEALENAVGPETTPAP